MMRSASVVPMSAALLANFDARTAPSPRATRTPDPVRRLGGDRHHERRGAAGLHVDDVPRVPPSVCRIDLVIARCEIGDRHRRHAACGAVDESPSRRPAATGPAAAGVRRLGELEILRDICAPAVT